LHTRAFIDILRRTRPVFHPNMGPHMKRFASIIGVALGLVATAASAQQGQQAGAERQEIRQHYSKLSSADKKKVQDFNKQIQGLRQQQYQILGMTPPPQSQNGAAGTNKAEVAEHYKKLSPADQQKIKGISQQVQQLRQQEFQVLGMSPPAPRQGGAGVDLD
jgi:uncharacterized protein (DUF433 family)